MARKRPWRALLGPLAEGRSSGSTPLLFTLIATGISVTLIAIMFGKAAKEASAIKRGKTLHTERLANNSSLFLFASDLRWTRPSDPTALPLIYPDPYYNTPGATTVTFRAVRPGGIPASAPVQPGSGGTFQALTPDTRYLDGAHLAALAAGSPAASPAQTSTGGSSTGLVASTLTLGGVIFSPNPATPYLIEKVAVDSANALNVDAAMATNSVSNVGRALIDVQAPPTPTCQIAIQPSLPVYTPGESVTLQLCASGVIIDGEVDVPNWSGSYASYPMSFTGLAPARTVRNTNFGACRTVTATLPQPWGDGLSKSHNLIITGSVQGPADPSLVSKCLLQISVYDTPLCAFVQPSQTVTDGQTLVEALRSAPSVGASVGNTAIDGITVTPTPFSPMNIGTANYAASGGHYSVSGQTWGPGGTATCSADIWVKQSPCRFENPAYSESDPVYGCNAAMGCFWTTELVSTGFNHTPVAGGADIWTTSQIGADPSLGSCPSGDRCFMVTDYAPGLGTYITPHYFYVANFSSASCTATIDPRINVGCFDADTPIRLGDGTTKMAKLVRRGDWLWNPLRHLPERVTKVTAGPETRPMIEIFDGVHKLRVTSKHPIWARSGVKAAEQVVPGDMTQDGEGQWRAIVTITKIPVPKDAPTVWNFVTDGASAAPEDHLIESAGLITGDLAVQEALQRADDEHRDSPVEQARSAP